jgi:hypothetical protein
VIVRQRLKKSSSDQLCKIDIAPLCSGTNGKRVVSQPPPELSSATALRRRPVSVNFSFPCSGSADPIASPGCVRKMQGTGTWEYAGVDMMWKDLLTTVIRFCTCGVNENVERTTTTMCMQGGGQGGQPCNAFLLLRPCLKNCGRLGVG